MESDDILEGEIHAPEGIAAIPVGNWQLTKVGEAMIFEMYVTDETIEMLTENLNFATPKQEAFIRQFLEAVITLEKTGDKSFRSV
jgi:hypothetical protein